MGATGNADAVAAELGRIARDYPQHIGQVLATCGLRIRKNMAAAIPKGSSPLSFKPLDAVTPFFRKLARKSGAIVGNTFGGRLSSKGVLRYSKRLRERDPRVDIGYASFAAPYAESFQTEQARELSKQERRLRHIWKMDQPQHMTYRRPAREIIQPTHDSQAVRDDIVRTAQKRLKSAIAQAARKAAKQ